MSNIDKFLTRAESAIEVINDDIEKLGFLLIEAKKELSGEELEQLHMFLLNRFLTQADIKAAIMVAEGKMDKRLAFAGVKNSKIMNMSPAEHKRLLSGEKFPLRMRNGDIQEKSWGEMSDEEKNQLLGPKGGIHLPHEQKTTSGTIQESTVVFETAEYDRNKQLILSFGKKKGKIATGTIVQALLEQGDLDTFIKDLVTIQKQVGA